MIPWIKRIWKTLFRPHDRPEIREALSAIEEKKKAGANLRETMQRLSERM